VSIVGGLGLITALSGLRRRSAVDTEAVGAEAVNADGDLANTDERPQLVSIDARIT
jgi:hypothetical protein